MNSKNYVYFKSLFALVFVFLCGNSYAADKFQPNMDEKVVAELDKLVALRQSGKFDEAIPKLNELLQAHPDYYRAIYNLGVAYVEAGDYQLAIDTFKRAEAFKNENNIVDYALKNSIGWVHLLNGDMVTADKYFTEAIVDADRLSGPARGRLYNNYAQLKISRGEYGEAREYLERSKNEGNQLAAKTLKALTSNRE